MAPATTRPPQVVRDDPISRSVDAFRQRSRERSHSDTKDVTEARVGEEILRLAALNKAAYARQPAAEQSQLVETKAPSAAKPEQATEPQVEANGRTKQVPWRCKPKKAHLVGTPNDAQRCAWAQGKKQSFAKFGASLDGDVNATNNRSALGTGYCCHIDHKNKVLYYTIWKAASWVMRHTFENKTLGFAGKEQCFCDCAKLSPEVLKTYLKFSFVRDPISRAISGYGTMGWNAYMFQESPHYWGHQDKDWGHIHPKYTGDKALGMQLDVRMKQWSSMLEYMEGHGMLWDIHVMPQTNLLSSPSTGEQCPIDFIGRQECMSSDWDELRKLLPRHTEAFKKEVRSKAEELPNKGDKYGSLEYREHFFKHKANIRKLCRLFDQDFACLGYGKPPECDT